MKEALSTVLWTAMIALTFAVGGAPAFAAPPALQGDAVSEEIARMCYDRNRRVVECPKRRWVI